MTNQEGVIAKKLGTVINRNSKVLISFIAYCQSHPSERFWQALRNWSKFNFIYVSQMPAYKLDELAGGRLPIEDTFYWEDEATAPTVTGNGKEI